MLAAVLLLAPKHTQTGSRPAVHDQSLQNGPVAPNVPPCPLSHRAPLPLPVCPCTSLLLLQRCLCGSLPCWCRSLVSSMTCWGPLPSPLRPTSSPAWPSTYIIRASRPGRHAHSSSHPSKDLWLCRVCVCVLVEVCGGRLEATTQLAPVTVRLRQARLLSSHHAVSFLLSPAVQVPWLEGCLLHQLRHHPDNRHCRLWFWRLRQCGGTR